MVLCVSVCLFTIVWAGLQTPSTSQSECSDGELRLVNGFIPSEGRVEICFNDIWGTVCDDDWDNNDARVVCRQLGFLDAVSVGLQRAFYGEGEDPTYIDDTFCVGTEANLVDCSYNSIENCIHSEDASVQCTYNGDVTMTSNRQVYQNNSIIDKQNINTDINGAILCLTSLYPCCSDSRAGSWYFPDGSPLQLQAATPGGEYYQDFHSRQTVLLYRSFSATTEGLFHCEVMDSFNMTQYLYIGIYSSETGNGVVSISDISYDSASQTITCTSTGGPATSVTWSRDNVPIIVDGNTYQRSQLITDTSTATYQNRLRIIDENVDGIYACNVSNLVGTESSTITLATPLPTTTAPLCRNGDAIIERTSDVISALCYEGAWYNVQRQSASSTEVSSTLLIPAILGSLFGLSLVALVGVVIGAWMWTRRENKRRNNITTFPTQIHESNLYNVNGAPSSVGGEHMVANALYDATDDMTENMAYTGFTIAKDRVGSPEEEYEMVSPVTVGEDGYSMLSPATSPTRTTAMTEEEGRRAGREGRPSVQYDVPILNQDKSYSHLQH